MTYRKEMADFYSALYAAAQERRGRPIASHGAMQLVLERLGLTPHAEPRMPGAAAIAAARACAAEHREALAVFRAGVASFPRLSRLARALGSATTEPGDIEHALA